MIDTPIRDQKASATRARIAEAALELFVGQGYAATTIDQIAYAAGVARRTIFRHFATMEAILLDHFVVRRKVALQLIQQRPHDEPPLVSLHAVLRELCEHGYDRRALAQIRSVLATNPQATAGELRSGLRTFERNIVAALQSRPGQQCTPLQIHALTLMAFSWVETACSIYLKEERTSLVACFDEAVATCLQSAAADLAPSLDS